ncbi:response regulator [Pseudomonas jinjuensis]|uniref:histidine kinase n=1 Tax=Pseudomonas jinjuensis TaxID=198616 RepID=A0A1H0BQ28_9PSED|nr:response regulator [Pseudomonas jinjuensis]SDN47746.1 two-component system, NarL family, sensor histidine kinase EvgS/two-component system, NarL family, response regulator EvgA [Pseudomonas jinjuensis]
MSRILIADEHPVTRHAVRLLLEGAGHQVVGEAENGVDALSMTVDLKPDLLIVDIDLSRLNGLDVIARVRARGLKMPILAFSTQDSEHMVGRFLQAGAAGFVSKHDDLEELSVAVSTVLRGRSYFPSELLGTVNLPTARMREAERIAQLSNRELSVLYFLANGYCNHEIAAELSISEKTVSTYRTRLKEKLNLHSMPELIDFARRNNLVGDQPAGAETMLAAPVDERLQMLRAMVESLPAAFYVRDTGGRLLYANPAFLRLYEVELEEVIGTRATDVDWYSPTDAATLQDYFMQAVAAAQPFSRDIEVRIHGRRRVLHHWGSPYRDVAGDLLGMVCCSTDITERQDQLQAVRSAKEQAELGNQQKLDFLVSASHEFSVPLQALRGMLRMVLKRATLNDEDRAALTFADDTAGEMLKLVNDLRGIASLECGEAQVARQPARLEELASLAVAAQHAHAEGKGLELRVELNEAARRPLLTDPRRFRDALEYLLEYVIRLTESGWVRLGIQAEAQGQDVAVRIEISGAPHEQPDPLRVYSLDELAEATASRLKRLTPVGLTIARRLVESLHGELVSISPPEQGAMVSVHMRMEPLEDVAG